MKDYKVSALSPSAIAGSVMDFQPDPEVVAIAHTVLVLLYRSLSTGQPYQERGAIEVDEQKRNRLIRHHVRRLGKLGIAVSSLRLAGPNDPGYVASAPAS